VRTALAQSFRQTGGTELADAIRVLNSAWVGIVSVAVVACGSPTAPTNNVTPDFIAATGMNVVAVGSTTRFSVTAYIPSSSPNAYVRGAQQTADISTSATWSSDNPGVASISSRSIVGRAAGVAKLTARYMSREYTIPVYVVAPSPSAQQFAGRWSGVMKRFCTDLVGDTRSCYPINGQPYVSAENVSLSLTNANGVLQGLIEMGGGTWTPVMGPVVGGVNGNDELVIGGAPRISGHETPIQLRDWHFALSGARLTGSGTSDSAFVNIYGPVWQRVTYSPIELQ
jgi:hypothetical protein